MKMRKLVNALALIGTLPLLTTTANAEAVNDTVETKTIYVTSGSSLHFQTSRPFKNVYVGNKDLLTVNPGITERDLNITANQPDGALVGSSNVLVVDENGRVVDNLKIEVTPFNTPSRTITILKGTGKSVVQHCRDSRFSGGSSSCIDVPDDDQSNKGIGNADRVSVTRWKDGSTSTSKTWSTPPE